MITLIQMITTYIKSTTGKEIIIWTSRDKVPVCVESLHECIIMHTSGPFTLMLEHLCSCLHMTPCSLNYFWSYSLHFIHTLSLLSTLCCQIVLWTTRCIRWSWQWLWTSGKHRRLEPWYMWSPHKVNQSTLHTYLELLFYVLLPDCTVDLPLYTMVYVVVVSL